MGRRQSASTGVDVVLCAGGIKVDRLFVSLLEEVEALGSLRKAAASLGVSYSYAWTTLEMFSDVFGEPLVVSSGERWRGSSLSEKGREVVDAYERLWKSFSSEFDETYATIFPMQTL